MHADGLWIRHLGKFRDVPLEMGKSSGKTPSLAKPEGSASVLCGPRLDTPKPTHY